jgi:hypothetical protein
MRGTAEWDPWEGSYRRTLIVNPVLTGDPPIVDWVASGTRLMAILNAIPEIGDPLLDPWLVIVEPGIYDIGAQTFTNDALPLTIRGAGNFRSVIYTTAAAGAVFTNNPGGSLVLEDLNLTVQGPGAGSLAAIQNTGLLELTRMRVSVNGQGDSYALRVEGSGSATVAEAFLSAETATSEAAAIFLNGDAGRLFLRNTSATGTGGNQARGVLVDDGEATIVDSEMEANSAANTNYGLALENGALAIVRGGKANASSGTAIGLYAEDSVLRVDGGTFSGNTRTLQCLHIALSSDAFVTRAALGGPTSLRGSAQCPITATFSSLGGAVTLNGGTITCRAVTDSANNFLATTCP